MTALVPDARRAPRDSLATKIIFFVFFSTFVTALVVSWISVQSTHAFLRAHLDAAYPLLAERARERIAASIREADRALVELAESPALVNAAHDVHAAAIARETLEAFLDAHPIFAGVLVRPTAGRHAVTSAGEAPPRLGRGRAGDDAALATDGDRLVLTAPLGSHGGASPGRLVATLDLGALRAALTSLRAHDDASVHLVDRDGRVLASSEEESLVVFDAFPASVLASAARHGALDFQAANGRRGIAAQRAIGDTGLAIVVAQPLDVAMAPVFSVLTRVFVIDLAIILAFSFLAYEITSKIVRPLEALSEGARRISEGELDVEVADTGTQDEIGLLTRTFNDMASRLRRNREEIDEHHQQLRDQNDELQRANEVLEQLSITDGLTKLHNHRYFQEALSREIKRVTRTGEPLSILLIDIDDFKGLNDRLGHAEGDVLLVAIARVLNESVRESDVLARYGGEEFVVLATGTDLEGATFLAEKVRTAVAETDMAADVGDESLRVTVSIGVSEFAGDRKRFFGAADRALYRAKAAGKNCVMTATPQDLA
jgi:diguanylate cyclase (GGDEF)-like protein